MEFLQPSDSALIDLYLAGRESAFAQLLQRHQARVFTTIHLVVRDEDVANDLTQDTFIKAIRTLKSGRYQDEGKFGSWLCRIAHNLAIDAFRRAKRAPQTSLDDNIGLANSLQLAEESADDAMGREESHAHLRRLIQELPAAQKEVLLMRHYGDMSFQEIADATGVSINTALGRMRYALINLRKKMAAYSLLYDTNLPHPTLLRYVYNELPADEQHVIEEALLHDPELAEACAEMLLAQRTLDHLARRPRPATAATILQYSRTFLK